MTTNNNDCLSPDDKDAIAVKWLPYVHTVARNVSRRSNVDRLECIGIADEVLTELINSGKPLGDDMKGYIAASVRYRIFAVIRRSSGRQEIPTDPIQLKDCPVGSEEAMLRNDDLERLQTVWNALTFEQQRLVSIKASGLSFKEMSKELDVSLPEIKNTFHTIRVRAACIAKGEWNG